MTTTLKFFGFIFLFVMAEAFTQSFNGKTMRKRGSDSIRIWKQGMIDGSIYIEARIRIFDKRMRLIDSLKAADSCITKDTLYGRAKQ